MACDGIGERKAQIKRDTQNGRDIPNPVRLRRCIAMPTHLGGVGSTLHIVQKGTNVGELNVTRGN